MKASLSILKIMGIFNLIIALATCVLPFVLGAEEEQKVSFVIMGFLLMPWGIVHFKVISGLKREKYWAWITGIIIFGLYISSITFPLGIWGLYDLLKKETRQKFASKDLEKSSLDEAS